MNCVDHKGRSALYLAAQYHHMDTVKALANHGADVDWRDVNGVSPLIVAAYQGSVPMCELLISLGADPVSFVSGLLFVHLLLNPVKLLCVLCKYEILRVITMFLTYFCDCS